MEKAFVKVHMYGTDGQEIKTENYGKSFEVYEKNGKLGIDWNEGYQHAEDVFVPFEAFTSSVIFENAETGTKFSFNTIKNDIEIISKNWKDYVPLQSEQTQSYDEMER
ncbi:MAG: hypothetical protein NC428_07585 [Clostridium sp.]|nr:hypothetical protein [Clostridium sp.]